MYETEVYTFEKGAYDSAKNKLKITVYEIFIKCGVQSNCK